MLPDRDACYRALDSRDPRFDGRFFVAVKTTRIYCRSICPAGPAKRENVAFYATAAEAQAAGFRPCLRCRPELAPENHAWLGQEPVVARALALINDGALDGDGSVDRLAAKVGLSSRQLRRLFERHVGATPLAVAQTRRVLFAKQLIHDTTLPMTEVALAAGFGSLRRFNATFRELYGRPPGALRRARVGARDTTSLTLTLAYRPPYDWDALLAHLAAHALPGLEQVADGRYSRVVRCGAAEDGRGSADHGVGYGVIEVSRAARGDALQVTVRGPHVASLAQIVARVRRMFDVDADVEHIGRVLAADPALAPHLSQRPGLRVPGGWEPFELAVRALLGQQVSVAAARTLGARLVQRFGAIVASDADAVVTDDSSAAMTPDADVALTRDFPTPAVLATADLTTLGLPRSRADAITTLARAALEDPALFDAHTPLDDTIARLVALRGIGEWTAQYVALRALREPDAFPAGDIALQRALAKDGVRPSATALLARAEAWRPWRAYAAQHLWTADAIATATPIRDVA